MYEANVYNGLHRRRDFSIKNNTFVHSQSNHNKIEAPTLINMLNLFVATLMDGYKLNVGWMNDHVERTNRH